MTAPDKAWIAGMEARITSELAEATAQYAAAIVKAHRSANGALGCEVDLIASEEAKHDARQTWLTAVQNERTWDAKCKEFGWTRPAR